MPNLSLFERASECILVTWTASCGGIVLIVTTEDRTTRYRSFPNVVAFTQHQQAMQRALSGAGVGPHRATARRDVLRPPGLRSPLAPQRAAGVRAASSLHANAS